MSSTRSKSLNLNDLDENLVNKSLYLTSTPDLLIRTSGEVRLSDFLLSKFSEIFAMELELIDSKIVT